MQSWVRRRTIPTHVPEVQNLSGLTADQRAEWNAAMQRLYAEAQYDQRRQEQRMVVHKIGLVMLFAGCIGLVILLARADAEVQYFRGYSECLEDPASMEFAEQERDSQSALPRHDGLPTRKLPQPRHRSARMPAMSNRRALSLDCSNSLLIRTC